MIHQQTLGVPTRGRGTYDITAKIELEFATAVDPQTVRSDLERFMARVAPDGDPIYDHTLEGPDDMPAHVRSILTNMDLTVPVSSGRCALGTWQGIYLYEHRHHAQQRRVVVTIRD